MKLYIIVRGNLSPGYQTAQSIHAFREFVEHHPEVEKDWYSKSNTIVVLKCRDEEELSVLWVMSRNLKIPGSLFKEPDLNDSLTAIALAPGQVTSQFLSHLPLADGKPM